MLRPRIIPFLLLNHDYLDKTVKYSNPKYIGDPLNAVKIFNEKHADELAIIDYEASNLNKDINFELLKDIAEQSRMPISYGGGITSLEQAERLINYGIEKVCISSSAFQNPNLCTELADKFGTQSVVVVLDVKKDFLGNYQIFINRGKNKVSNDVIKEIEKFSNLGAGEIVIINIDRDGTMVGYDLKLAKICYQASQIPITFLGGAKSHEDISNLIKETGTVGCGAGSIFVFKGKYRAVLINYPSVEQKLKINDNIDK